MTGMKTLRAAPRSEEANKLDAIISTAGALQHEDFPLLEGSEAAAELLAYLPQTQVYELSEHNLI